MRQFHLLYFLLDDTIEMVCTQRNKQATTSSNDGTHRAGGPQIASTHAVCTEIRQAPSRPLDCPTKETPPHCSIGRSLSFLSAVCSAPLSAVRSEESSNLPKALRLSFDLTQGSVHRCSSLDLLSSAQSDRIWRSVHNGQADRREGSIDRASQTGGIRELGTSHHGHYIEWIQARTDEDTATQRTAGTTVLWR